MFDNIYFSNEHDFKKSAFQYTFNNFEEFLKEFPKLESKNLEEKFKKENQKVLQQELDILRLNQEKEQQHRMKQEAEERQALQQEIEILRIKHENEQQHRMKQETEQRQAIQQELDILRLKQENEQRNRIKQETENRRILQQELDTLRIKQENEFEEKINNYKKIIEEYSQANIKKITGVNSLYKGETFEKYIEVILQDKFKNYTIDGTKKMNCMDIRMRSKNLFIGIECKAKQKVSIQDVNKFIRDKVNNSYDGSIFISETPIPNTTTDEHEWKTIDNTLWIQSNNETIILSAMKNFLNSLEKTTDEDETQDKNKIIVEHQDFILTTYDNFQSQKQNMLTQEKQLYKWIKQNKPQKLKNHLFIVTGSKLLKKYKDLPY